MSHAHEAIRIPGPISVRELAELLNESPIAVIKTLMAMGVMANINQVLDPDTAALAAEEMGHPVILPGEEEAEETTEEEVADIEEEVEPATNVPKTCNHAPPLSLCWGTSTTEKQPCWTPSDKRAWQKAKQVVLRSISAPIRLPSKGA